MEQIPQRDTVTETAGHEESDLDARVVARLGAVLAAVILALMAATYWIYNFSVARRTASYPAPPPLAYTREPVPEPRLQVDEPRELRELRAAEDDALHGYAWVDKERGLVRMPIDRAIEVLAQRGLPARAQAPARKAGRENTQGRKQ